MRTDILDRKQEILEWIAAGITLWEMKERLCCKYETLRHYLKVMDIEYAGQQHQKGRYKGNRKFTNINDYINHGKSIKSHVLKQKLIEFGVKKAECECCHNTMWNGQSIPLELHHKNGDHYDNSLDNLQILCANCHAQQPNNSGRGKKQLEELVKARSNRKQSVFSTPVTVIGNSEYTSKEPDKNVIDWEYRRDLILASGIDLTKFGWQTKIAKKLGLTRRQIYNTVKKYPEDFKDVFIPKPINRVGY